MKKYALSFLTLTMALSSSTAFAAPASAFIEAQADVVFIQPVGTQHDLIPTLGLIAGQLSDSTELASGIFTVANPTASAAFTLIDNGNRAPNDAGYGHSALLNNTDGINPIDVRLERKDYNDGVTNTPDNRFFVITPQVQGNQFGYRITTNGAQIVQAGTYNLAMSAVVWVP